MSAVITIENLGKRYRLHHGGGGQTLRDKMTALARRPFARKKNPAAEEDFWALRDVSFEIPQGDVVGVVGRNGAGKSTLLKILSRITEPTTGRITLQGRVASLLEVGTGFHAELSGRENIFLNGAILGMTRREIRSKFDEIVAFAEIERFLDTPVKHYSSGMYVRLAFAVAAHLEPEILIVDEVLAVGDAAFQKKCLGKMQEVAHGGGRTVLFVSHNSAALLNVCHHGIWLEKGQVVQTGAISDVLSRYHSEGSTMEARFTPSPTRASITSISLDAEALAHGHLKFLVSFIAPTPLVPPIVGITVYNKLGQPLGGSNTRMAEANWTVAPAKSGTVIALIDSAPLRTDSYRISVWLGDADRDYDVKLDALVFDFVSSRFDPKAPSNEVIGPIDLPWQWRFSDQVTADRP